LIPIAAQMERLPAPKIDAGDVSVQDLKPAPSAGFVGGKANGAPLTAETESEPDDAYEDQPDVAGRLRRPRRRRPSGVARLALALGGVVVTLALVAAGVGFVAISRGPIPLDALQPAIAENLQSRLAPGYKVKLGPISLSHGASGLGLAFSGLSLSDPQGRKVVDAPGGRIGLDALALLGLSVKVRSLALEGLQIALKIGADGQLSLSAGSEGAAPLTLPAPQGPTAFDAGAAIAGLAEAMAGAEQPLAHVAILDGRLTVLSEGRSKAAVYDHLRLTFDRSGSAATAGLAADGPSGAWSIDVRAEAGATRRLSVEAHTLALDDILHFQPHPPGFDFDSPISFAVSADAAPGGGLTAFSGSFSLGAGKFDPHDPDGAPPIAIDEATGEVRLDSAGHFAIEKLEVLAGATHARITGLLIPPTSADPLWRASLRSRDILFAERTPHARLDDVALDAHFDAAAQILETDKFTARGPHLSGEFDFRVHLAPAGPEVKFDLAGRGALLEMLRLWPVSVNGDARKWCDDNIKGGEVVAGTLKVDWDAAAFAAVMAKQAAPDASVNGHFQLRNGNVDLLPGLPATTGLDASGDITGRHFRVSAPQGVMELSQGRRLIGANLFFAVPDTGPAARVPAEAGARITGGADALADLLSLDALKRYAGVPLDATTIKGQFQGDLKLDLTLGKGVQPEDQVFHVNGSLANLSIDKFLGPQKLEQGALDVAADRGVIKIGGTGQVFGAPARLDLAKAGQDIGSLTVSGVLDDAVRAKMGFNNGPKLRGPVGYKLKAPLDRSGADVEVDLAKASVDSFGGPPWKAAGKPGKASFTLKPSADGVAVTALSVEAGALSAKGSAAFNNEGALRSLKLAPFRMSAGDDLKLDIDGGDRPKVSLRGAALDARSFLKAIMGGDGERDGQNFDLDVKVAQAQGYNRELMTNFEFSGSRRNGAFGAVEARGRLGGAAFSARGGDAGAMNVHAEDAGALARFLDVYGKMEGGTIDLSLRQTADGARGSATIRKFAIRGEAALRKLEQAAPPPQSQTRGFNPQQAADADPPMKFEKLLANFVRTAGRLDVKDGVIANASFGLTTQGFIDFAHEKMDLNGVYVPLYGVNNALGNIPLFGALLTGGQNEGVFAINYRASGPTGSPSVNINPLSGMTPGFLRKIFGAIDGTTPPSQGDPAQSYAPSLPNR
jgi:hypothetical protein